MADSQAAASCHGPVSQRQLLQSLGVEHRLQALLENASPAESDMLQTGYLRLIGGGASAAASVQGAETQKAEAHTGTDSQEGMGLTYQAMAITAQDAPVPVAFEAQTTT